MVSLTETLGGILSDVDRAFSTPAVYKRSGQAEVHLPVTEYAELIDDINGGTMQTVKIVALAFDRCVMQHALNDTNWVPKAGDVIETQNNSYRLCDFNGSVWRFKFDALNSDRIVVYGQRVKK